MHGTLGVLERMQSSTSINMGMGFRFALIGLAVIAVFTGLQEIKRLYSRKTPAITVDLDPPTYAVWFANRILVAIAVLLASPAGLYRLGAANLFGAEATFQLFQLSCVCMICYFILSELVRLRLTGMSWREARWRTVPFALGFAVLFWVGLTTSPHH